MTVPSLPLDGIHVIDLTQLIAGPTATMALGQLGATVTKLERPSGDLARSVRGARSDGSAHLHSHQPRQEVDHARPRV